MSEADYQNYDQLLKGVNINFDMAKFSHEDQILHSILKNALVSLFKRVGKEQIGGILLTGSLANGEGTVIIDNSFFMASDFDLIIYLDFIGYIKNKRLFENLSIEVTQKLKDAGFNTHVVFLPHSVLLNITSFFSKSSIYDYEFTSAKNIFGKTPTFNNVICPTKNDALELSFTVISDLVFLKPNADSKVEESYVWAKRALTLLNSVLIFYGVPLKTYEKRIAFAETCGSEKNFPLNQHEITILRMFTEFKLSGSLRGLMSSLGIAKIDDLLHFQIEFLRTLSVKILYYELSCLAYGEVETKELSSGSFEHHKRKLPALLKTYLINSKTKLPSRFLGILMFVFSLFSKNEQRNNLFLTFLFHKQSPKVILNGLVTLLLIDENPFLAARNLKDVFPWLHFNGNQDKQAFVSLWRTSEQSIKLR